MTAPIETFKHGSFAWREIWELHPNHVQQTIREFGWVRWTGSISLFSLKPKARSFVDIQTWVFNTALAFILFSLFSGGAYLLSIHFYPPMSIWFRDRALAFMAVGAPGLLLACCFPTQEVGIAGTPPVYIRHGWLNRRRARDFAESVIARVPSQFNSETLDYDDFVGDRRAQPRNVVALINDLVETLPCLFLFLVIGAWLQRERHWPFAVTCVVAAILSHAVWMFASPLFRNLFRFRQRRN